MKKIVFGLIIGLTIGLGASAFASDSVTASFVNMVFNVNGTTQTIDSQPLSYNGTTYLPVRSVANMLGYDVTYKADTKTIELNTGSAGAQTMATQSATTQPVDIDGLKLKLKYDQNQLVYVQEQLPINQKKYDDQLKYMTDHGSKQDEIDKDIMLKAYKQSVNYCQSQITKLTQEISDIQSQINAAQ